MAINCTLVGVQEDEVMPHDSQGNADDSLGQDNGNLATVGSLACELARFVGIRPSPLHSFPDT